MTRKEHLLTIIAEECAEVAQRCSKALRFGEKEIQPEHFLDNETRIVHEFNDLVAVMEMYFGTPIEPLIFKNDIEEKKKKVEKYLLYSMTQGTVSEMPQWDLLSYDVKETLRKKHPELWRKLYKEKFGIEV